MDEAPRQPPQRFASGDTLWFELTFGDYSPANGWALEFTLTDWAGVKQATLNSVANENSHVIQQDNFAAALPQGNYVFAGYAINAGKGFRHQIYEAPLKLLPNLADGTDSEPTTTHAQRMIYLLENQLEEMAKNLLTASEQQRTRFEMVDRPKLMQQLREYKEIRRNEENIERARNGQSPTNEVVPIFMIPT